MKRCAILMLKVGIIAGCQSDSKQAEAIHSIISEAEVLEKTFNDDQQKLTNQRDSVTLIHNEVLQLDHSEVEAIQKLAGQHEIDNEYVQLDVTKSDFSKVHDQIMTLQKSIDAIQNAEQKEEASKLITLETKRKEAFESFTNAYRAHLDAESTFFAHLEQGKLDSALLDEEAETVTQNHQRMSNALQQFNTYTKQFNDTAETYFQLAEIEL